MMAKPVSGHEHLRRFIGGFIRTWSATHWHIVNILGRGDLVMVERHLHPVHHLEEDSVGVALHVQETVDRRHRTPPPAP
jgi:hypothetical protein